MIDLTNYFEIQEPTKTRIIMTCYLRLDKKSMLEMLMHEKIFINGKYYKVPERTLLQCLLNKRFGETRLDLEQVS
jgi:hypothetical protein